MTNHHRATSLNSSALAHEDHSGPTASHTSAEFRSANYANRVAPIPPGGAR